MVSLPFHAFARWLGWLSAVAAAAQTLLCCTAAVQSGPLATNGWLSTLLYPFFLIWLVPATVVMVRFRPQPQPDPRLPEPSADSGTFAR